MPRLFSAKVILYLCLLILLDWAFLAPFRSATFQPVLIYLVIPYAAFEWHWRQALRLSLIVGVLRDVLSSQPLGVETAVLFTAALAIGFFVQKIERRSWIMRILAGFIFVYGVSLLVLVISNLLGFSHQSLWECFALSWAGALSTVIFLPVFFYATSMWFGEKFSLRQYELFK